MPFFRRKSETITGSLDDVVDHNDTASLAPSQADTLVNDEHIQRFTATGRPMPEYKPSGWANMCGGFVANAPQHLPHQFTDDSIIPVAVMLKSEEGVVSHKRRTSWINRLKGHGSGNDTRPMKVVRMPRGEYLRFFARDPNSNYIGTEPEREWTAEALQEKFGQYQDLPPPQWKANVASGLLESSNATG